MLRDPSSTVLLSSPPQISVVLPAYLEEENLRLLLPRIRAAMDSLGVSYEVLVVDTKNPLDNTSAVCSGFGARHIRRQPADSFGDAVRSGITSAGGVHVVFMDADGSHPPELLPELLRRRHDFDVVIASRYCERGATENSVALIAMSRILNWTYSLVLGIPCKDASNSFRVYRAEQLQALELRCDNFDIVQEILIKLIRKNPLLKLNELPFTFKKRLFGRTKRNLPLFVATYLFTIIRLRFFS